MEPAMQENQQQSITIPVSLHKADNLAEKILDIKNQMCTNHGGAGSNKIVSRQMYAELSFG